MIIETNAFAVIYSGVIAMSKKPKDIKDQIEKTFHTVADVAQQQYEKNLQKNLEKNLKKAHKNVDKQVDSVRDRLEEFDSWAVESVNDALENVEKQLEKEVNKTVSRVQKTARSLWKKINNN